jgi:hypothetical protein
MITLFVDTEQLARVLAERSGKTPAEIIQQALGVCARDAGVTASAPGRHKTNFDRMMETSERCSKRPVLDGRTPDEILG